MWGAAQALAFALDGLVGTGLANLARWGGASALDAYAFVFVIEAAAFVASGEIARRLGGARGAAPVEVAPGILGRLPPRAIRDFAIPGRLIKARVRCATMISPKGERVDMPVEGGFVGRIDRAEFDEWLRERAVESGAERVQGEFEKVTRERGQTFVQVKGQATQLAIGADGVLSKVGRQEIKGGDKTKFVFAYHEIVATPKTGDANRCEIYYDARTSPDFYAWVFPHGDTMSVGTGSANTGFSLKEAVAALRGRSDLGDVETLRREGAPIPLKPLKRWDNGRDVVLAGDASGVVAPASGEGT